MTSISFAARPLLAALLILSIGSMASAGGRASWFKSLRMPGTNASCCDIGDCHKTEADWHSGHWWAVVNEKWRQIPPTNVLKYPFSIDGAAYVCTGSPAWSLGALVTEPPIYCFVPPNWAS
jgi:hypothetical protein